LRRAFPPISAIPLLKEVVLIQSLRVIPMGCGAKVYGKIGKNFSIMEKGEEDFLGLIFLKIPLAPFQGGITSIAPQTLK
jgi:hypothetical protein